MGSDLLKEELIQLQYDYMHLLKKAKKDIFKHSTEAIVDEINIFWYKYRAFVNCVFNYMSAPYDAYIFTGATFMDISDNEHFPFVALGNYHFLDDPICRYANILDKSDNDDFDKKIKEQIVLSIDDNISIIENCLGIIYILPLRLFAENNIQLIYDAAMKVFLSMFKEKINFEDYKNKFKDVDDIEQGLIAGLDKVVLLSKEDDLSDNLKVRLERYKTNVELPLKLSNDAEIFWFAVHSSLMQAFDIMLMCFQYQLVPYVRYRVTFEYMLRIIGNFSEYEEAKDIIFQCAVAYILYKTFDKSKVSNIDFIKYYNELQNYQFSKRVFADIKNKHITIDSLRVQQVADVITKHFNKLFDFVKFES